MAVSLRFFSFYCLSLSIIVWTPERLNCNPALLIGKCKHFAMMTSFDLKNIDLGTYVLHLKDFIYGPTYPANCMFLAFTGAEIAGGGGRLCPPPFPGRVILRPSPGSVLMVFRDIEKRYTVAPGSRSHKVTSVMGRFRSPFRPIFFSIFTAILNLRAVV